MKKATFYTAGALLLASLSGLLTSCKDYLDVNPDAYYTSDAVFSDVTGATNAVIGAYDPLSGDAGYGNRLNQFFPYDVDDMISSPSSNPDLQSTRRQIARYHASPANSDITSAWNQLFQGLERANICIKNIPAMPLYKNGSVADTMALHRLYGEALTLRAIYVQELIRNWGDVPIQFSPSVSGQNFALPNADRNASLTRIIADLAKAEELVPWRSQSAFANERFTKGGIKALRARIALARGGYSENPRTGQMERATDYRDYYQIAHDECASLMTTAARSEHNINPTFENIWRSIAAKQPDATNELMLQVGAGGFSGASDSKLGYYDGPRLYTSMTYGNTSPGILAVPTYFYSFDSTDARRDVTICTFSIGNASTPSNNVASDYQYGVALNSLYAGKFRRNWRPTPVTSITNYNGYNWPIIRYADVLLMFAEAENELNGPSQTAQNALLEVRTRGFGGNRALALANVDFSSPTAMLKTIQNERLLEFGDEGIRKYDLLRWNLLGAKIIETKNRLTDMSNGVAPYDKVPTKMYYRIPTNAGPIQWATSFYQPTPATQPAGTTQVSWRSNINAVYIANIQPGASAGFASDYQPSKGKELLPIPQATLDADPALLQNFGY